MFYKNESGVERLPDPILLTGAARSGTSLVAGAIHLCGAFMGTVRKPNKYNEKGMFENDAIVNEITKPYLRENDLDPLGQYPLPDISRLLIPNDWRSRVESVMKAEGYPGGPWMYKGAKMALFWPVWHYAFPLARWVIIRRDKDDIVNSCLKTPFMRAFRDRSICRAVEVNSAAEGWGWWVDQHLKRFKEMQDEGLNCFIIWPERMIQGDYSQLYQLIDWLGLKWNSQVLEFVDPKLWKARRNS